MAIPPADPNQYFTPTFDKDMPQSTATHFRQLYLSANQHDQAIKLVHSMMGAATSTTTIVNTTSAPTGVIPGNTPAITHEWIDAYDSSNGLFTQTQPDYSDLTGVPTLPANTPAVTHEFVTAYNSTTGAFTQAQPSFPDVSGVATTAQIGTGTPAAGDYVDGGTGAWTALPGGLTVVITTAALTTLGTTGSMTFTNGRLTASTPAT